MLPSSVTSFPCSFSTLSTLHSSVSLRPCSAGFCVKARSATTCNTRRGETSVEYIRPKNCMTCDSSKGL